ncbi:hypothetical protein [Vibrio sp. Hal054]|uniref:hypothetical protein n=1 Tax=Vibrio sp. Hal054 TaxID=3035158 RepID=UPI00301D315C
MDSLGTQYNDATTTNHCHVRYSVRKMSVNSARIAPVRGHRFTDDELVTILAALAAGKLNAQVGLNYIHVVDTHDAGDIVELIEALLPTVSMLTSVICAQSSLSRTIAKLEVDTINRSTIEDNVDTFKWIKARLGEMNESNAAELIRYLTGQSPRFNGTLNSYECEAMRQLGCIKREGESILPNFACLKNLFNGAC